MRPAARRLRTRAALLGLAACLTACSSVAPEPPQLPFTLPEGFAAESAAGGRAWTERWWQDFGDAQLDRFVDTALLGNPDLAQAIARTRIAQAQARLQRADQLPQVGLGAGAARQRQNVAGMPGSPGAVPMIGTGYDASLDVSWELDLWGRLSALSASARADYLASTRQLRAMRQSVAAQVVQMYFEIVHARAQAELSARTVQALAEMARQVDNRVRAGIASPADGMLANANLQSARAGLEQRRETLARSLRQLQVLMGGYPSGSLRTAQALPPVPPPPSAGIPAQLLARRPDVQAAELGLLAAGYRLGAAQRSFLPALTLSGSAGYSGSELAELFSSGNLVWSIAGRLLQPVFQGGRLTAQVHIAQGQRDEALYAYAQTALNALAEVESALAVDALLREREAALDASAGAAEQAVHVSLNRYLQGIDPFLNVLESQQRALDGRSAYLSARHARLENRIALHLALGGGFEDEPPSLAAEPSSLSVP
ncbi:efflux transporter outer membrane subunit [Orrella sp. JC864]|uniref:efflux transporter outer membrane subunit n=1 Tax=Orrella sp. JC864 TaxID=3120298 RepID=UPI00300A61F7